MEVLVLGASRGIGRACVRALAEAGHEVRAFARSADAMTFEDGVSPMAGDATRAEDVAAALAGMEAVVIALGVPRDVSVLWTRVDLFSRATETLLQEMARGGPDRLVCITGIGAGRSRQSLSAIERLGHRALLGRPYADKDRQEEMIRASDTRWTILRPTILTEGPRTGRYRILTDPGDWRMGLISRADVADAVVRVLADEAMVGADPVVTR